MYSESREQVEENRERWRSVLQRAFRAGQSTCVVWFRDRDTQVETGGRAGGHMIVLRLRRSRNESIRGRVGHNAGEARLRWFGDVQRRDGDCISRLMR